MLELIIDNLMNFVPLFSDEILKAFQTFSECSLLYIYISEINALTLEQFVWLFGNIVEGYPDAAKHVASLRPFTSARSLKKSFGDYLEKLDNYEKENILFRYSKTEKVTEGLFTMESQFEQENIEFRSVSNEEKQILGVYNNLYKEKFHFPFVMCIDEYKIHTILVSIQTHLQNTRDNEFQYAIQEIKKICNIRIDDLVWSDV